MTPGLLFLLLALPLAIITTSAIAQTGQPRKAKIVLHNGTVMKGTVAEWVHGDKIKLLLDGNKSVVVEIAFDQVKSMEFEGNNGYLKAGKEIKVPLEIVDPKGTYISAAVGLHFGEDETNYTIGSESGYRFNDHWALGLGINYDHYDIVTTLPVFASARAYLNRRNETPYLFIGGGYGFSWFNEKMEDWLISNETIRGGTFGQTGLGYQVRGKDVTLAFVFGFKFQKTKMEYDYNYEPWRSDFPSLAFVEEKRMFRRMFFTVAAVF
jgi:hypothetical protein